MTHAFDRRDLMKAALGAAAGLSLPWGAAIRAAAAGSGSLRVTELAPNMVVISGAGGNVVAAADEAGIVMVDGGRADMSQALLDTVQKTFSGKSVRTLFNTHWHPEQTGSNRALGQAGAEIVAHANTKLWLGAEIKRPWEDKTYPPLPDEARPTQVVYNKGQMPFAGGRIAYGHMLQAHTDGDIYVHFPDQNVLVTGGALTSDRWPLIDWWTGGWMGGLVEGVETLLSIADPDTKIVPVSGPVIGRAELEKQREMYMTIFFRLRDLLFSGLSPEEAVAADPTGDFAVDRVAGHGLTVSPDKEPTGPFKPEWDNADAFVRLAFQSLWGYYAPDV